MKRAEFERLLRVAAARAGACGGVEFLSEPLATIVTVASVQHCIDRHGGLLSFFEIDFEGRPSYEQFSAAYRRIGATEAADLLDRAVRLFPFEEPHLNPEKRIAWIEGVLESDANHEIWHLSDELIENPDAWAKLKAYVEANRDAFPDV